MFIFTLKFEGRLNLTVIPTKPYGLSPKTRIVRSDTEYVISIIYPIVSNIVNNSLYGVTLYFIQTINSSNKLQKKALENLNET